ncbi:MAG: hypothetical protein L7U57_04875 [Glaciecola sp.]|nr:hypothetical protein [Glaciecola sp.]
MTETAKGIMPKELKKREAVKKWVLENVDSMNSGNTTDVDSVEDKELDELNDNKGHNIDNERNENNNNTRQSDIEGTWALKLMFLGSIVCIL